MKKQIKTMILLFSMQFIYSSVTHAAECQVGGGAPFIISGNDEATIPIDLQPIDDVTYTYGNLNFSCRFGPDGGTTPGKADYWKTYSGDSFSFPFSSDYTGGLIINGSKYNNPVGADILVAEMPGTVGSYYGPWVTLNMTPFINKSQMPKSLDIKANQSIGTILIRQTASFAGPNNRVVLNLIAKKDVTLWPNSCTINNNMAMDIDFGDVIDSTISTDPKSPGQYTRPVNLSYSCSDKSYTNAIGITLTAKKTASFNNKLIGMENNPNLGVALVKADSVIAVNSKFNSNMTNGEGSDSISFNLVRNPSELPIPGDFTTSAVLQIGLP